uniref:SIFamide n=1 Tax=Amphibalanus amphitrite TaxID=1232801 RepID=I3VNA4_AMPAM|nr:SIFamide [Amphibalanus amphitrite]
MGSRCAVRRVAAVLVVALVAMALLAPLTEAGYRKPTFNGSIFGKRAAAAAEAEAAQGLARMCAAAYTVCGFPAE